ncbi:high mobility group box domain-containing protein, partial [Diaporthe sp. PMI_573]
RIKRPLNAFMLYRKVYQRHAEDHYTINDHRLVSKICGASWALEPEHIRTKYQQWADVERTNHSKTWPEYKFSP